MFFTLHMHFFKFLLLLLLHSVAMLNLGLVCGLALLRRTMDDFFRVYSGELVVDIIYCLDFVNVCLQYAVWTSYACM